MIQPRLIWAFIANLIWVSSFGCDETDVVVDARNVLCNGGNTGSITVFSTFASQALPYQYSINGGAFVSDSVFTGLSAGKYVITVKNSLNCILQIADTIFITEPPKLSVQAVAEAAVCGKDGRAYPVVSGGFPPYIFTWNTTPPSGIDTLRNLFPGSYQLSVRDQNGCRDSTVVTVDGPDVFDVQISPPNPTISLGESIQLESVINRTSGNFSYQWIPEDGLSCSNCSSPTVTIFKTSTYFLFVTDEDNRCKAADTITITVDGTPNVFIPNAFTPNGDQRNDVLKVYGLGILSGEISIYDSRGFLVYRGRTDEEGWDGTINNTPAQEGIYFYHADVTFIDNSIRKLKGQIVLIR
jgi:gliding motility-associated-like protein